MIPSPTLAALLDQRDRLHRRYGHNGSHLDRAEAIALSVAMLKADAAVQRAYRAQRAATLDGEPVCAEDAAILRGPEVRRAA